MKHHHNLSKDPLYRIWNGMKTRCYNSRATEYKNYGGRGIDVCPEWKDDAPRFIKDILFRLGPRPSKNHSIDRIDNNRGYYPDNVRWATFMEQKEILKVSLCRLVIENSIRWEVIKSGPAKQTRRNFKSKAGATHYFEGAKVEFAKYRAFLLRNEAERMVEGKIPIRTYQKRIAN